MSDPMPSEPIPNPADRIYIRNLSHQIVNFVESLEKPVFPNDADEHDRTCPICKEHYAPLLTHTHSDIAMRLPCSHVVGSNCLIALLSKKTATRGCPVCNKTLIHVEQDRKVDIIRYLFFLLHRYGYPIAQKLLRDLDYGGYYILKHEIRAAEKEDPKDEAKIAALRAEQEGYKAHWIHRSSLSYPAEFEIMMDEGRGGKSVEEWIQNLTIRAVAWVIQHQLSKDVLVALVIPYVNTKDLLLYLDDELYGPDTEGDLGHVWGVGERRGWAEGRGMWDLEVGRWRFEVPTEGPFPWDITTPGELDVVLGRGDLDGGCVALV